MTDSLPGHAARVYRVDRFTVPEGARAEFLSRVRQTHEVLRAQPGFLQDLVLEEPGGQGVCRFLTLVEWADAAVLEQAKAVVGASQKALGFSPQELLARLGIEADMGRYRPAGI